MATNINVSDSGHGSDSPRIKVTQTIAELQGNLLTPNQATGGDALGSVTQTSNSSLSTLGSNIYDNTVSYTGIGSIKRTCISTGNGNTYMAYPTYNKVVSLAAGTNLTFSAWAKSDNSTNTSKVIIYFYDINGVQVGSSYNGTASTIPSGQWKQFVITVTIPIGAVGIYAGITFSLNTGESCWVDTAQLEIGSSATAWKYPSVGVASDIPAIKNKLTQYDRIKPINLMVPNVATGTEWGSNTLMWEVNMGPETVSSDTSTFYMGSRSYKCITTTSTNSQGFFAMFWDNNGNVSSGLPCKQNQDYVFSAYIKAPIGATFNLVLRYQSSTGVNTSNIFSYTGTGNWDRIQKTYNSGSNVSLSCLFVTNGAQAVTFNADCLQLEERTIATPWTYPGGVDTPYTAQSFTFPDTGHNNDLISILAKINQSTAGSIAELIAQLNKLSLTTTGSGTNSLSISAKVNPIEHNLNFIEEFIIKTRFILTESNCCLNDNAETISTLNNFQISQYGLGIEALLIAKKFNLFDTGLDHETIALLNSIEIDETKVNKNLLPPNIATGSDTNGDLTGIASGSIGVSSDSTISYQGQRSFNISNTSRDQGQLRVVAVPVPEYEYLTFQMRYYATPGSTVFVVVQFGQYTAINLGTFTGDGNWHYTSGTVKNKSSDFGLVTISVNGSANVDAIQLEIGTTPTTWSEPTSGVDGIDDLLIKSFSEVDDSALSLDFLDIKNTFNLIDWSIGIDVTHLKMIFSILDEANYLELIDIKNKFLIPPDYATSYDNLSTKHHVSLSDDGLFNESLTYLNHLSIAQAIHGLDHLAIENKFLIPPDYATSLDNLSKKHDIPISDYGLFSETLNHLETLSIAQAIYGLDDLSIENKFIIQDKGLSEDQLLLLISFLIEDLGFSDEEILIKLRYLISKVLFAFAQPKTKFEFKKSNITFEFKKPSTKFKKE